MVAEPRYRSAVRGSKTSVSLISSSEAMAHPMLRGAEAAIGGDAMMRAASVGVIGLITVGEAVVQGAHACGWCERRQPAEETRGRRQIDIEGHETAAPKEVPLIHSTISTIDGPQSAATTTNATTKKEVNDQKTEIQKWQTEAVRLQNIIQQQSDDADNRMKWLEKLHQKLDEVVGGNADLKNHMNMEAKKVEEAMEHNYQKPFINNMERFEDEKDATKVQSGQAEKG